MDVRVKDNGSKMEKIVDYSAYKKEWLDGIENNSSSSQNAHDRFSEKLFSQWLEIDESSKEDFYSLKDLGFSFAYYFEGDGKNFSFCGLEALQTFDPRGMLKEQEKAYKRI